MWREEAAAHAKVQRPKKVWLFGKHLGTVNGKWWCPRGKRMQQRHRQKQRWGMVSYLGSCLFPFTVLSEDRMCSCPCTLWKTESLDTILHSPAVILCTYTFTRLLARGSVFPCPFILGLAVWITSGNAILSADVMWTQVWNKLGWLSCFCLCHEKNTPG